MIDGVGHHRVRGVWGFKQWQADVWARFFKMMSMETPAIAWLDGNILALADAKCRVEDRGFLFGDGVYEVVRAYDRQLFAADAHWLRLRHSAQGIDLELPMSLEEIAGIAENLLMRSGLRDAEIYVQVTRGAARRNHLFPTNTPPTLLIWVQAPRLPSVDLKATGASVVTLPDERWARCHLKTISLLANCLAKEEARRRGCDEAILVRDGWVTEGTSCNVLLIRGDLIVTPPTDQRILPGVTRACVLDQAPNLGMAVVQRPIAVGELFDADEIILTSTIMELMPVRVIDGSLVGAGRPGPAYRTLATAYSELTHRQLPSPS